MSNIISNSKQAEVEKREWLRKKVIPLLTLLLVIAITVGLLLFFQRYPEKVKEFENYGYLGVFVISLAFNATIVVQMPGFLVLFALGTAFNPILVGLVGATGGTIGEITGYMVGYSGRGIARSNKMYARAEGWMRRWGTMTIFVFSLVPFLPLDIAGMVAGVLRFPIWKFLLVCWVGKVLLYTGLVSAGAWGWEAVLRYIG